MSDVTVQRIDDLEPYTGPHAREGIRFKPMARPLGVTAWGMNVLEMAPGATTYPEHDHAEDGQEEVFVVLAGAATLVAGDDERRVEAGEAVRIGPGVKRSWRPGDEGVTLLALGGTPGKAYAPRG
ncbi:MAG TPA: cupin domain-containing protein [Gemmatimonadota bacterium]|nr:cupin domain-containing protein [Gemmatimonadota bacterium]